MEDLFVVFSDVEFGGGRVVFFLVGGRRDFVLGRNLGEQGFLVNVPASGKNFTT